MTQKKISELNAASTLAGTEVLPVVQSSATVKATVAQVLANLNATNLTSGTVPLARLSGITNTEISNSAAIALSKIALPTQSGNADKALVTDGTTPAWGYPEGVFVIACSDETTNLTTGNDKVTFRAPFAFTVHKIPRASLSTASSSGLPTCDINVGGSSILGANKLSIDANEKTSTTAATATTVATSSVSDDAEITIDIDTAGTGAKGLKVYLYYRRT
jgi:hypothetical protein